MSPRILSPMLAKALADRTSETEVIATAVSHFRSRGAIAVMLYDFAEPLPRYSDFPEEIIDLYRAAVGIRRDPAVRESVRAAAAVRIPEIFRARADDAPAFSALLRLSHDLGIGQGVGSYVSASLRTSHYISVFFAEKERRLSDAAHQALQIDIELVSRKLAAVKAKSHQKTLSRRERQFIMLAAAGASDKQIARLLCIAPSSVRTLVERTFEKLNVSTRTEAVVTAAKQGIVFLS